ncbi:hypothetical protein [Buttiauxella gaviniae]|uniref:hypothetical protein n=1 Tax=Buttiauxella gaviniae TaxID=82990 RepID=UPI003C762D00
MTRNCILIESLHRSRLMNVDPEQQRINIVNRGVEYYIDYPIREFTDTRDEKGKVYLIATNDAVEDEDVFNLIDALRPSPIN